jgi:hypothetical protein
MANANNQAAARPKSMGQTAGSVIFKFRHPFLAGQLSKASTIDEVDFSSSLQLNSNFFEANPAQDSSHQEPLVDGSVITITNHLMNGVITLQALPTTGFPGTGDFIACGHLIVASKDDVGGTLTVIRSFNGKKRVRVYYGVFFKRVPHERIAGSSVVPYPVELFYTSWVEGLAAASVSAKAIWAVGNKYGVSAVYDPYKIDSESVNVVGSNKPFGGVDGAGSGDDVIDFSDTTLAGTLNDVDPKEVTFPANVTYVETVGPEAEAAAPEPAAP